MPRSTAPRKQRRRIHHDAAPHHTRRPFIIRGYREPDSLLATAVDGLLSMHNETLNVWTHLLGAVYFASAVPRVLENVASQGGGDVDTGVFLLFLACAQAQMLSSATYHMLNSVSAAWGDLLLKLDVVGIIAMILGSFTVGLYNGFRCQRTYFCEATSLIRRHTHRHTHTHTHTTLLLLQTST
jgi:adiponectin receptor